MPVPKLSVLERVDCILIYDEDLVITRKCFLCLMFLQILSCFLTKVPVMRQSSASGLKQTSSRVKGLSVLLLPREFKLPNPLAT